MKKEIRGMEAVRYAEVQGITFDDDEDFLLRAEGARLGRPATSADLDDLFEEKLGDCYDRTNLLPGEKNFSFLVERYGDGWIYVAVEGNLPQEEEREVLRLFRCLLREEEPYWGGSILDLVTIYGSKLRNTGFPSDASLNLLFHAALRLVEQGELEAVMDRSPLPEDGVKSYGNRRFFVPPDAEISLSGALCDRCHEEFRYSSPSLHQECAGRLRTVLGKMTGKPYRRKL
jgi:hypothetical protein